MAALQQSNYRSPTAHWVIAVLLAFIAGMLFARGGDSRTALAQNNAAAGSRGVYAFTGQLDQNQYGLFMLDIEQGTIWVYEMDQVNGTHKLRLTAARSWVFDRYLKDFNGAEPTPDMIRDLLSKQRIPPAADAPAGDSATPKTGENN